MNIAKETEKYINNHPSIKDALKKNLINYSKLSRLIADKLGTEKKSSFEAILISCRRCQEKLGKEIVHEDSIINLLKDSHLELKNKIIAVVIRKNVHYETLLELQRIIKKKSEIFHIIEGANAITIATNEEFLSMIKEKLGKEILKTNKDLVEITIKSSAELETTPGVMGYLYSQFAEHGINIVETMSCYTDTIFMVQEDDVADTMKVLKF